MRRGIIFLVALVASAVGTSGQSPAPQGDQAPVTAPAGGGGRGGGRGGPPRVIPIPDAPILSDYVVVEQPLRLPEGMTFGVTAGVAINSRGHVFVYQRMPVPVLEFDARGQFVRGLFEGTATRAHSIQVDAQDNFWLVDSGDHTVTKRSPQGEVLLTLGTKGVVGTGDADAAQGRFNIPSDVAIAPNGDILIAQGEAGGPDPRVIRFDRTGKFLNTWSLAFTEGLRSNPHAIAVDRAGVVYVADRNVMRIRAFRPDGTHVRDLQLQNLLCGLFIDRSNQLWVATCMDGQVMKLDWDGKVVGFMGKRGTNTGEFSEAHMLSVAPNGDIYVADAIARKVEKFMKR